MSTKAFRNLSLAVFRKMQHYKKEKCLSLKGFPQVFSLCYINCWQISDAPVTLLMNMSYSSLHSLLFIFDELIWSLPVAAVPFDGLTFQRIQIHWQQAYFTPLQILPGFSLLFLHSFLLWTNPSCSLYLPFFTEWDQFAYEIYCFVTI